MHTYDYTLRGTVTLNAGITMLEVEAALAPFLRYCRTSHAEALRTRQFEYAGPYLQLNLNFPGYYGPVPDQEIRQLQAALRTVSMGADYIELINHDAIRGEPSCTPLFIGSPEQQATAQMRYGLDALRTWVEPIIGSAAMDRVKAVVLGMTRLPVVDKAPGQALRSPTQEPG